MHLLYYSVDALFLTHSAEVAGACIDPQHSALHPSCTFNLFLKRANYPDRIPDMPLEHNRL